jgi:acetylornithine/succinyldiaminopimelate/putrescine aminotransferase
MGTRHPLAETFDQIIREQQPNLFRLYVNPYVAQSCLCLARYVSSTWPQKSGAEFQSFLSNSFDEALSGAIKLARYAASLRGRPASGLVLDPGERLGPFAGTTVGGGRIEFLPGLAIRNGDPSNESMSGLHPARHGFVVLAPTADGSLEAHADELRKVIQRDSPLVITCLDRTVLASLRRGTSGLLLGIVPDIVVFDESFVDRQVPFAAFTAGKELFDLWNQPGKTTFHSTTFQPNTVSSLHFVRCLQKADPEFHAAMTADLERARSDMGYRRQLFRSLYSPSLYSATCATGFDVSRVRAAGDFVFSNGNKVFDAVSGVACSVRGHNPTGYVSEVEEIEDEAACRTEVTGRLRELTGLDHVLPAVSGAGGVETALKLALVAQHPRRHVLALKAGFGGKTLFALTGTWNASYKERLDPLYPDVLYIDPFAADAIAQLESALSAHPVAVVQIELIQAVGGVRAIPETVLRFLDAGRQRFGFLLLVDEVQTGMYRTGPFTLSRALGLTPDLLVLGKGASDMMFPFALVMYSSAVGERIERAGSTLPEVMGKRHGYDFGYRTVLNVLRRAETMNLPVRVAEAGKLFTQLLKEGLAGCGAVREVRVHGLLIGIELDATRWPRRWFRKKLFWFYLFNMLQHRRYPVLIGFCQYEPNVLKITPPLTVDPETVRAVCATIVEVLRKPFYKLAMSVIGGLIWSKLPWRRRNEHPDRQADEPGNHRV